MDSLSAIDRTMETNMNVSSSINHTMKVKESVMVANFMDEVETFITFKIANFLCIYWIAILVPIGLVGNTLSFLIMIKSNNRNMSLVFIWQPLVLIIIQ